MNHNFSSILLRSAAPALVCACVSFTVFLAPASAQQLIPLSDTAHPVTFLLTQNLNHINGLTGGLPTLVISKNGGAFTAPAGSVSEIGNGVYAFTPSAGDVSAQGKFDIYALASLVNPATAPTSATAATGGSIPAATYFTAYTFTTAVGETASSPTTQVTTTGTTSTITVTSPALPTNATGVNIYIVSLSNNMTRAITSSTSAATFAGLPSSQPSAPGSNTAATSDPANITCQVVSYNPYDSAALGLTQISTIANHQMGRFHYTPATHVLQLYLDDGTTLFGSALTLTLDGSNNILQR